MAYNDRVGALAREIKRKALEQAKPSEPRRQKRPARNPHENRPGRGQTTQYQADKVAERTLKTTYVSKSHPLRRSVESGIGDPYWQSHFYYLGGQ